MKFEKFVAENEVKRSRALKKYEAAREQNILKQREIEDLTEQMQQLWARQRLLKDRMIKYKIYEDYLMKTLDFLPSTYLDNGSESSGMPIIRRHETLSITNQELQQRLGRLEQEVEEGQRRLQTMQQEHSIKKLMASKELSELQSELETLIEKNKQAEVNLLMEQGLSRERVEEVGRLLMAINNLAEQCYIPKYGPLENMTVLTMMDMVKEYILDKADTEKRARRMMESGSAMTSRTALTDKRERRSMKSIGSKTQINSSSKMEAGSLVSCREDITSLFPEQTPGAKLKDLSSQFSSVRKVLGDGNCFYRAFCFAHMESALHNDRALQRFKDKIIQSSQVLSSAGFDESSYKHHLNTVVNVVEQCQADEQEDTLLRLFNEQTTSDSVVQYLRLLTSAHLQNHADFFCHFVEAPNLQTYCHQEVEAMAMESDHVDILALSQALDIYIHVVSMEGDDQQLAHHIIPEGAEPSLHLLYQTEHGKVLILPKSFVNLSEVHHVVWADEQQTETLFGGSCRSATAMDISLRCPRNLKYTGGGGQAVGHCQGGGEHECLPHGIEVNSVQHLQQTLQLCKVASFYHAIGFIDDQAPADSFSALAAAFQSLPD
ncbi:hypothetical protein INR49_030864, partial [Caranx melampygus]